MEVTEDGKYEKKPCCQSCASPGASAEDNWVWSKQGEVAMHLPERWGILQFETQAKKEIKYYEEWDARCAAMAIYYAQKAYHKEEGKYTTDNEDLKYYSKQLFPICNEADVVISLTEEGYEASATIESHTATVNQERYLAVSKAHQKCTTAIAES